jgi:hypothetical protein
MARTLRDGKLDTRNARLKLKSRREPHWRSLSVGRAVGYGPRPTLALVQSFDSPSRLRPDVHPWPAAALRALMRHSFPQSASNARVEALER